MLPGSLMFSGNSIASRVDKLVSPYQSSIDFVLSVDRADEAVYSEGSLIFESNGLSKIKNVKKLKSVLSKVKRIASKKKPAFGSNGDLELVVSNLEKVVSFVETRYSLMVYNEIFTLYNNIDEQDAFIVNSMIRDQDKLGLSLTKSRGLYKFLEKTNLDLRRLGALFEQQIYLNELVVSISQLKSKLTTLKSKIVMSSVYRSQWVKDKFLWVFKVVAPLIIAFSLVVLLPAALGLGINSPAGLVVSFVVLGLTYYGILGVIATKHIRECSRYNIPFIDFDLLYRYC